MNSAAARQRLRAVAAETMTIVHEGGYRAPGGAWIDIRDAVDQAVAGTRLYLPDEPVLTGGVARPAPLVDVTNESTLAAARRLGPDTAALVFASARNPGGGFRNGARAQEEDIARASALHACLETVPDFYQHHRGDPDLRYSDRIIYSPGVPVFRDDHGALLDQPCRAALITAAAPNLRAVAQNQPELVDTVPAAIERRAARVLEVAAAHGHRRLVLGAWGCGVFGNDPAVVARAFDDALRRVGPFDHVVFAVLDHAPGTPTHRAFLGAVGTTP
ncbi:TIGR02452 family protein [Phytohabitans aurantiacus]|uniref:TIGR02452 family protein n=1 Tax=Phytohabitans aurantiacus TaxID=3016789 RepID=A0ABQ5R4Q5_9ACTN|nr:TIGR02452 family protein [Phytohabitans aurantiacus]GLI01774.1 TIGR02452 family protein [Phytohabitans aurantiacus]